MIEFRESFALFGLCAGMWMICAHAREDREKRMNNTIVCRTLPRSMTPPFCVCIDLPQVGEVFPLTENAECTAKTRRITTVLSARAYSDNAELRAFLKAEEVRKRSSAGRETQRESGARALAKRGILP